MVRVLDANGTLIELDDICQAEERHAEIDEDADASRLVFHPLTEERKGPKLYGVVSVGHFRELS